MNGDSQENADHHPTDEDQGYLWDRSGPTDPLVQHLEEVLGTLRYRGGPPAADASAPVTRRLLMRYRVLRFAAAAAVVLATAGMWLLLRGDGGWELAEVVGSVTVDSDPIGATGRLGPGQWLETAKDARVRVTVADIGSVIVHPESHLRLITTRAGTEHRLELARGKIEAMIAAPPRLFFVNTPSAIAVDLGCIYTLEVAEDGRGLLEVTFGIVSFERKERESIVPANAACRMGPLVGPGTPYFADAPEPLKRSLDAYDFQGGRDEALDAVLDQARTRDALTLWHLLSRATADQIGRVFDRLAALAPPPTSVTRQGILGGDRTMLDAWWDDLGLGWK